MDSTSSALSSRQFGYPIFTPKVSITQGKQAESLGTRIKAFIAHFFTSIANMPPRLVNLCTRAIHNLANACASATAPPPVKDLEEQPFFFPPPDPHWDEKIDIPPPLPFAQTPPPAPVTPMLEEYIIPAEATSEIAGHLED